MQSSKYVLFGLTAIAPALASAAPLPTQVFSDDFSYVNEAALDAAWTPINGQSNYLNLVTTDAAVDHEPYANMGNGLIARALSTPIDNQDWSLSFKVIQTAKQRAAWVGLFDDAGQKGYAVLWDSGNATAPLIGNGTVMIKKFDLATPIALWSENGVTINDATTAPTTADSGHEITTKPFATIELSWTAATGALNVTVDGVQKLVQTDTSFTQFSKLYMKGNGSVLYDDVVVTTVPEPVALALVPLTGALALLPRRRRA